LNDLERPVQLKVRFTDGTLDVRMLWISEPAMRDFMNMGLSCQRQKCGQLTAISEHMTFVRIFVRLLQRGRRIRVEPLNLVIIHIMQHHLSDILIGLCVAVCHTYYYKSS